MTSRHVRLAVLALLASLAIAGCARDESTSLLAQAKEHGITIGIVDAPPDAFEQGGRPMGAGPALATAIFDRLGIDKVNFEVIDAHDLIGGLTAHRYDVIAVGMAITPDRAGEVTFADPDHCTTSAATEPTEDPTSGDRNLVCKAFAFRAEDLAFRDAFNSELVKMKQAHEILPLVVQFGVTASEVEAAVALTVEDVLG